MKRTLALILCISIVLTMSLTFSVTVSADYTSRESDNFENSGSIVSNSGYEYVSNNGLLVHGTTVTGSGSNSKHISLVEGAGYDGGTALYVHADTSISTSSNSYHIARTVTKGFVIGENETLLVRYKVKVNQIGAAYVPMPGLTGKEGVGNNKAIATGYSNTDFKKDKWYTIVAKISGTTAIKNVASYALCEDGTLLSMTKDSDSKITISVDTSKYTEATQPVHIWPAYVPRPSGTNESHKTQIYIDDLSVTKYSTLATQNISLDSAASNIKNGDTEVSLKPFFRLTFDHDLATGAADTVKLYKKSDKTNPVECTITAKTFDGLTLTPNDKLDLNTEYVIDISGISGMQGQALKDAEKSIGFKTIEAIPLDPVIFTGATATKGGAFTDGTLSNVEPDDSFTLTFDQNLSQPVASQDVVLYKSEDAEKTPVAITTALSSDKKSVSVTPSLALSLNTAYTLSFAGVTSEDGAVMGATKTVSFTTIATRDAITLAEDLNGATGVVASYQNTILAETTGKFAFDNTGYKNTTGLRFNNVGTTTNTNKMMTKAYDLDENEKIAVEFKLNLKSYTVASTSGHGLSMGIVNDSSNPGAPVHSKTVFGFYKNSTGPYIGHSNTSAKLQTDPDTFYTVVIVTDRKTQTGYIYDETGKCVYTRSVDLAGTVKDKVRFVLGTTGNTYEVRADMTFDDFRVYRVHNHTLDIDSARSSVANGDDDVNLGGAITVAFNQPLTEGAAGKAALYNGSEKLDATVEHLGGSEIVITPSVALKPGRTYTISLDTPVSLLGKAYSGPESISFTTKTIYNINAVGTSLTIGSDGTISAGEKTLTLDNIGAQVNDAVLLVAIYSGSRPAKLIGCETFDVENLSADSENTIRFTLAEDYANADRAEILLCNSIGSMKPFMKAYKITR